MVMNPTHLKQLLYAIPMSTLLLIAGCNSSSNATFDDKAVVTVDVMQAQQQYVATGTIFTGVITPNKEIAIVPEITGKVTELPFETGDSVKKGQVLLKLDDRDLVNAVKQAEAAAAVAKATIDTTISGQQSNVAKAESSVIQADSSVVQTLDSLTKAKHAVAIAQNDVQDSQLTLQNTQQILEDARTDYQRTQQLYTDSLVSKAELENSQLAVKNAETKYNSAKLMYTNKLTALETANKTYDTLKKSYKNATDSYSKAEQQVTLSKNTASITASEQAFQQANVAVKVAQDKLNKAVIVAPIDGIIGQKNTDIGEMVSTQTPALVVVDMKTVRALTYVPTAAISTLQVGSRVQVKSVSSNDITTGTVKTISPLDVTGKGYPVEIEIPNPNMLLKSGMLVDLQVITDESTKGIVVPATAIIEENGKSYAYIAQKNHPKRVPVETVKTNSSSILITSGIQENDLIITTNTSVLSPTVTITYEK